MVFVGRGSVPALHGIPVVSVFPAGTEACPTQKDHVYEEANGLRRAGRCPRHGWNTGRVDSFRQARRPALRNSIFSFYLFDDLGDEE